MDKEWIPESVNRSSAPSSLKITDLRVTNINGLPKHCILLKLYTNQGIVGYGEVRDASSATYTLMLKSRILGENPLNVEKLFRRIRQFGGPSRQGGGVSGIEIALWDIVGLAYGVPVWQLLGGKYRDRVRVYCDTDVEGRHTGLDMGRALKARMDMGFTFLKMDLGIELLFGEEGCLNAPEGMLEEIEQYSMKAIRHQKGSIDRELMLGKNYEVFTIPHYATGIHITEKGLDALGFSGCDSGGVTFTVLSNMYKPYEFNTDELTGDVVNDAVYEKDQQVMEYLKIELKDIMEDGDWPARDVFNAKVTQAVTAGDSTCDLVMNTMVCTMPISTKGVFLDGKLGSQPRKHGRSDAL